MRALLGLTLFLAACASSAPAQQSGGLAALRGCWMQREDNGWATMRWTPEAGAWRGDWSRNRSGDEPMTAAYRLNAAASQLCGPSDGEERCFPVTWGGYAPPAANSADNRAVVDVSETQLIFALVEDGREEMVFRGARDACQ